MGVVLINAVRQTDMATLMVSLSNFANMPKMPHPPLSYGTPEVNGNVRYIPPLGLIPKQTNPVHLFPNDCTS